jgi:hypothetical protein
LAYTFARIGADINLKVEDYYPSGKRFLLRFREKGIKKKSTHSGRPASRISWEMTAPLRPLCVSLATPR